MIKKKFNINISQSIGDTKLITSFKMNPEIISIFGPSGSGKTSILNAIAGINKPIKGKISLGNTILFDSKKNINIPINQRNIGYCFQDERLFPHLNVFKNLTYNFKNEENKNIHDIIDVLDLSKILKRKIKNLSGGEKKRVALGRALISKSNLLLLDEPLSGVEKTRKEKILSYIKIFSKKENLPVLYVTHDKNEVKILTKKIFCIENHQLNKVQEI